MDNFRVAAKSFIVKDNNLLLIKRRPNDVHKPGVWEIPGGRLELGENTFEGLKRETKEETGLDIEVIQPLNIKHFVRDDGQTITMLIFFCKALSDSVKLSEEHTDYEWVPLNRCKEKIVGNFLDKEIDIFNKLELHKHF